MLFFKPFDLKLKVFHKQSWKKLLKFSKMYQSIYVRFKSAINKLFMFKTIIFFLLRARWRKWLRRRPTWTSSFAPQPIQTSSKSSSTSSSLSVTMTSASSSRLSSGSKATPGFVHLGRTFLHWWYFRDKYFIFVVVPCHDGPLQNSCGAQLRRCHVPFSFQVSCVASLW